MGTVLLNGKGAASFESKSTTHAATQLSPDGPLKVSPALSQIRDSFVQRLEAIDVFFGAVLMWLVRLESSGGVSMGPGEGGAACFCFAADSFSRYALQ